jgi:hypothetical protein
MSSRETTKGNKMKTSKKQMELEYLKAKVNNLEAKIDIYNDQFGPSDEHVVKLKNEVRKLDAMILDLMVMDQAERLNKAVIA